MTLRLGDRLAKLRLWPQKALAAKKTASDARDMSLLGYLLAVVLTTLIVSIFAVREAETYLVKSEATGTAVYWARLLESQIGNLDEMLRSGLVSDDDRATLDFARLAGGVRDYQVIRPDGVIAVSSWSGDLRDTLPPEMLQSILDGNKTITDLVPGSAGSGDLLIARAYVPIATDTGVRGAIKVDIDVTNIARNFRYISIGGLLLLITILFLAGGTCGFLILRNIRARRLSEHLQLERSAILEALAKGTELDVLLRRIAVLGESYCTAGSCVVLLLQAGGSALDRVVGTGGPLADLRAGGDAGALHDVMQQAAQSTSLWLHRSEGDVLVLDVPLRANSGVLLGLLRLRSNNRRLIRSVSTSTAVNLAQLAALAIEYRRAELVLNDIRQRNEIILNSAADGIFGVDGEGCVRFANPAAARLLMRSQIDMVGQDVARLICGQQAGAAPCPIKVALRENTIKQMDQQRMQRSDGSTFIANLIVSPVMREASDLRAVAVFHDVTDQIEARQQLVDAMEQAELASTAKSNFLANMSHELRTPLNAIIGFSEMMRREVLGPLRNSKYHAYADDIHRSGRHLLSLINDLLDLSKIEAGKLDLQEHPLDLKPLVQDCILFVRDLATEGAVEVEAMVSADVACVSADEQKLKQIITNLLSNAVKFTPPGGNVMVSAQLQDESDLVLTVSDSGVGIPPDEIDKVMARFEQATIAVDQRRKGTGLGLPLAKALAELHGGSLTLASVLDEGTTVRVLLPNRVLVRKARRELLASSA